MGLQLVGYFLFIGFLVIAVELAYTMFVWTVGSRLLEFEKRIGNLEGQVGSYRNYSKYLRIRKRIVLSRETGQISSFLHRLDNYKLFLGSSQKKRLFSCLDRVSQTMSFLDNFIPDYISHCKMKYADLFSKHNHPDDAQLEAVFKDDAYNLVIAAAGSGKTLTLTSRIAFLVKSGVEPRRILALAYTRQAREEMERRLMWEYGITGIHVSTFHSFGLRFARKYGVELKDRIVNKWKQSKYIKQLFDEMLEHDSHYRFLVYRFLATRKRFESNGSKNVHSPEGKYVAQDKTPVDSMGEWEIANFLFRNQIVHKHAEEADWAERSREHKLMEPDFTLSDYDIYIEHWGIDCSGEVAPWFRPDIEKGLDPSAKYKADMEAKRKEYAVKHKTLIETSYCDYQNKNLISKLEKELLEHGVKLKPLTEDEIKEKLQKEINGYDPISEDIAKFINLGKSDGSTLADIVHKLDGGRWNQSQISFAKIVFPIWQKYQDWLERDGRLDFNDMINEALKIASNNRTQASKMYSHILIDEFRDITDNQVELIKCFLDPDFESTSLFCVGDDWQNIFSFAGANVEKIVEFDRDFPLPERTVLEINYRSPKKIVDASNDSILKNKYLFSKKVRSISDAPCEIYLCERPDLSFGNFDNWEELTAKQVLASILAKKKTGESVLVLSRYNYRKKYVKDHFRGSEKQGVRFLSIHSAKGTEADYVLILGCVQKPMGFPTEIRDSAIFDLVRKSRREDEILEEERRLFYVALTRCRREAYIFTAAKSKSLFVNEISQYLTKHYCS